MPRVVLRPIVIVVATLFVVPCHALPADVSTWGAQDISEFMNKNAGVTVAANAIEKAGIQGDDLFDGLLNDKILEEDLGVDSAHKRAKILRALDALDKEIGESPDSIWEWRVANLRLCDMWLMPLIASSPSSLLLWSRFFDTSTGVLDKFDDPIDECNIVWFWIMVVCFPHYPLYSIISSNPVSGFAGVILYFIALFGILGDVLGLLLSFRTHFAKRMQKEIPGLIAASISYYVLWWIFPRFVLDFYLYLSLYVVAPFVAIIGLMATGTLVLALVANS